MRILHVSSPLTWRGGEQQITYLVEELRKRDTEQWILSPYGSALSEYGKSYNWDMLEYRKAGGIDPGLAQQIARIAKEKQIDIIHCHDAHAHAGAVLASALFGNKAPVVLSRRVDFPIGKGFFSRWKYNHRSIKAILCVSEAILKMIESDIHNKNILLQTVHSGIDTEVKGDGEKGRLRKVLGLSPDVTIVGNVAALAPHKDHYTFIDTALHFKDEPGLAFVIIGSGPLNEEIHQYAKDKKATNVYFAGFHKNISEWWPDLDVFLFTSKTEGLGTSVLDALRYGIPVVSTNAGGIPEIISHGESGLLSEVGDSASLAEGVRAILNDVPLRSRLIAGGYQKLRHFTKAATAEKTLAVYREVCGSKSK